MSNITANDDSKVLPTVLIVDTDEKNENSTIIPSCPTFPTNEEKSVQKDSIDVPVIDNQSTRPSQQSLQLLDELKYLLRPTNSLASPLDNVQASVRFVLNMT